MSWCAGFEDILQRDVPLRDLTWYRLGGPARWLCTPRDETELAAVFERVRTANLPWRVLGAGANVLVRDAGFEGVVFKLTADDFKKLRFEGERVYAGAGLDLQALIRQTLDAGLVGLEVLAGIPSTVGGAVRMNAGGRFGETATFLEDARVLNPAGTIETRSREQLGLSYRHSKLDDCIVIGATLALHHADPEALTAAKARNKEIWRTKHAEQPAVAARSSGCIFKNPDSAPAGKLLDDAGLKGHRIGGAEISTRHANFIIAHDDATAADVIALIEFARARVREQAGLTLETEVDIW